MQHIGRIKQDYAYIEKKSAAASAGNNSASQRETIELALQKMKKYAEFLTETINDAKTINHSANRW